APPVLFGLAWLITAEGLSPGAVVFWLAAPALVYAAARRGDVGPGLALVYGLLAAGLLAEVAPWGRALSGSILGYSLALGARYYGIGNEWMGVLTGSVLAALLIAREYVPRPWLRAWPGLCAGVMLLLLCILGLPWAGAKFGGMLTAGVGAAALAFLQS